MEKKNMVLLTVIAVATLLVAVVGATFAYFTATSTDDRNDNGDKGNTVLHTAEVTNTTVVANVDGAAGSFTAESIYPGHMEIAGLSVKVDAGELVSNDEGKNFHVPFVYNVTTNTITNSDENAGAVKYYLYRSDEILEKESEITEEEPENKMKSKIDLGCNLAVDGTKLSETCSFVNAKDTTNSNTTTVTVGQDDQHILTLIATGTLKGGSEAIQMLDTINVANTKQAKMVYYYFVLEFENKTDKDQNVQSGKDLEAKLMVA